MQLLTKWLNFPSAFFVLIISLSVRAQNTNSLTLEKAYVLAERNYPAIKQRDLIKQTAAISIDNLNKGYLPQLSFNGQATYQSDVTTLDFSFPGFNYSPLSKDQYKATVDVNQVIFDGGMIRQQKVAQQLNE
ncbi:MAG: TolC family protein, partial [Bacteroidia bacterium]|nr:TolC family protein [Bacteroidia bacterium]